MTEFTLSEKMVIAETAVVNIRNLRGEIEDMYKRSPGHTPFYFERMDALKNNMAIWESIQDKVSLIG